MDKVQTRARFDGLVELGGALTLAACAGFAAFKLAPSFGYAPPVAMTVSAAAFVGLGLLAMRSVKSRPREHVIAGFGLEPIEAGDQPLLLDTPYEEPLLLEDVVGEEPLLLDDPLAGPDPKSRVIRLFASRPMPTPGQLRERIDRHLAGGTMHVIHEFEGPGPDASDALYAALAELRRSLR